MFVRFVEFCWQKGRVQYFTQGERSAAQRSAGSAPARHFAAPATDSEFASARIKSWPNHRPAAARSPRRARTMASHMGIQMAKASAAKEDDAALSPKSERRQVKRRKSAILITETQETAMKKNGEAFNKNSATKSSADSFFDKLHTVQVTNFNTSGEAGVININDVVDDAYLHNALAQREAAEKLGLFMPQGPKDCAPVINPKAPEKIAWDMFIAVLILYSVLIVPFKLGFDVEDEPGSFMDVWDIIVDIFFGIDVAACFNQAFEYGDDSVFITDRRKIAKHYLKGWFVIDFLSTLPVYRMATAVASSGGEEAPSATRAIKTIRVLRLARLLKLVRLLKLRKLSEKMRDLEINPGVLRVFGLVSRILFVAHLFASLWYAVGAWSLQEYGRSWTAEFGATSEDLLGRYVMALHWTVATMMAVGYGDIYATTTLERGFSIVTQVVGALVFGWILATVAIFYESADPRVAEIIRKTKKLTAFMKDRGIPKSIQVDVINAFEYQYRHKSVFDENSVLNCVSHTLANSMVTEAYKKSMQNIAFIRDAEHELRLLLCREMKPVRVQPDTVLYVAGRGSAGLYMVQTGVVGAFLSTTEEDNGEVSLVQEKPPRQQPPAVDFEAGETIRSNYAMPSDEIIVCVFDAGSHFGHDASLFIETSRKHSPVTMRVAFAADLMFVPSEVLHRLALTSESAKDYLQGDANSRRGLLERTCCAAVDAVKTSGSVPPIQPIYFGESQATGSDPLLKRKSADEQAMLGMKLARRASLRHVNSQQSVVEDEDGTDLLSTEEDSKHGTVVSFSCERLTKGLTEFELSMLPMHEGSLVVVKQETMSSLLRIGFIHPAYPAKVKFDMVIALLILWSVIMLPYRIAFDDIPTLEGSPVFFVFEWCVDGMFFLDICVSFRTCYLQAEDQIIIAVPQKVALNYSTGWFAVDTLSTLPIDLFIGAIMMANSEGGETAASELAKLKLIRILRLIRLLKLARLFKLGKVAKSVTDFIDNPNLIQMLKLLLMTVFMSHLLGCFWFLVSPYDGTRPDDTWWGSTMLADQKSDHYIASVYWAFSTMTTVGYGDIIPVSTGERLYACMAMIAGATIFGYVIGNVATMSMASDIAALRRKDKIGTVIGYMKEKHISKRLRRKVENYLDFYFEQCSGFDEEESLAGLSGSLLARVQAFLHGPVVEKFSKTLFRGVRKDAAAQIVARLRTEVFLKGDIVFKEGDMGDAMYLVSTGIVLCVANYGKDDERVLRQHVEGSHFGQYAMLKGNLAHPYTATVAAATVVMVLSRTNVGIMVEEEALLADELEKMFSTCVRYDITKDQQRALMGEDADNTAFAVAPRINRLLLNMSPKIQRLRSLSTERTHSLE